MRDSGKATDLAGVAISDFPSVGSVIFQVFRMSGLFVLALHVSDKREGCEGDKGE